MPRPVEDWLPEPAPLPVRMTRILTLGCLLWALALTATLALPGLRSGDRDWWPAMCATGLGLGFLGLIVVRRGAGRA